MKTTVLNLCITLLLAKTTAGPAFKRHKSVTVSKKVVIVVILSYYPLNETLG
jgi:hypothetical protein